MAWDQLWIDKPHLAYAVIGFFVTVFSLISLFVKEKLYIGEATVAAIFGLIVGPHCLNWFAPTTWGNTDYITIEVSRIVLVVQIFAVAVELPKKYMLKHWLSVVILLIPVMTFGWLISSVFIWKLVPTLTWIQGLAIAACVTATDPVLASAVVGKGKFAKRVPGHLRNILSAESGCNDGMAFPFAYLAINIIRFAGDTNKIAFEFIVITCLYECVFGCVLGAIIGYTGRHLIKFAEKNSLIDRESFLVFYFVLALFCTGVGSIIGVDDLLVAFSAGAAFSWDGWFSRKTEESHVSNVIDLLLNMAYFVYFGAIIPWESFNNADLGISAWKLVILAILILLFRRLPIMLAMKPFTPDIRTWREAFFCGHFGPIGVGAVFISILVRAELEHGEPTPLSELPPVGTPNYYPIATIWPITTFLIISSIMVHGSSIAVFTLGKRLNNMTLTMSYTTGGNNQSWLSRLPRIEGGRTLSLHRVETEEPGRFKFGTSAKPAGGAKRRRKGEGRKNEPANLPIDLSAGTRASDSTTQHTGEATAEERINDGITAYQEGKDIIIEDDNGEVLATVRPGRERTSEEANTLGGYSSTTDSGLRQSSPGISPRRRVRGEHGADEEDIDEKIASAGHRGRREQLDRRGSDQHHIFAYQLDNDIIVENEDGDIIRRYRINRRHATGQPVAEEPTSPAAGSSLQHGIGRTLSWVGLNNRWQQPSAHGHHDHDVEKNEKDDIVPVEDDRDTHHSDPHIDEEAIRKHLTGMLHSGRLDASSSDPHHSDDLRDEPHVEGSRPPGPQADRGRGQRHSITGALPRNFLGRHQERDDDDEEEDSRPASSRDDDETDVERKRRLAALGLLDDVPEDDDDEEEGIVHRPSRPFGLSRMSPPPAIREEEDEEEDRNDSAESSESTGQTNNSGPSIQWGHDVKRGRERH